MEDMGIEICNPNTALLFACGEENKQLAQQAVTSLKILASRGCFSRLTLAKVVAELNEF